MGTTTTNFGLYKPAIGEVGWGALRNDSYDDIDSAMQTNLNHLSSDGSSHTFIDQNVTSGAAPTFDGANFTNVVVSADNVSLADSGALYVATDVEAAFAENRPLINANTAHGISDGSSHADVATNTLKVTNATHTDEVTGDVALTVQPEAITNKGAATVASGDLVLVADVDDSNNLKQVPAGDIGALAGPGATTFTSLTDTPAVFTGDALKSVRVNAGETALEFVVPSGGATLELDVTQANAFSVDEWVYHDGSTYELADASAATTAESIGIVTAATGADFTVQFGGRITGLTGLTAGEAHFLSETPGAITATAPTTANAIVKPVLVADSTTTGFIFNMRGTEITTTTSFFQVIGTGDGDAPSIAHNLGNKFVITQVYDDSDELIQPDDVTLTDANNIVVDLTSFSPRGGNYNIVILDIGTTNNSAATDLNLAGQAAEDIAIFDGANWVSKGGEEKIFVGSFTRDLSTASGTQAVTIVPFLPSALHLNANVSGKGTVSFGQATASTDRVIMNVHEETANQWSWSDAKSIDLRVGVGLSGSAVLTSFEADGFILTWTKIGAATGTAKIQFTAFR